MTTDDRADDVERMMGLVEACAEGGLDDHFVCDAKPWRCETVQSAIRTLVAERDGLRRALQRYGNDPHLIMVGGVHSKDCRTCSTLAALTEPSP